MQSVRGAGNLAAFDKKNLHDLPYPQGCPGRSNLRATWKAKGMPIADGQYHRHQAAEDHGDRIEKIAGMGDVMDPVHAHGVGAQSEKGVLAHADLAGIAAHNVPALGDDDINKGRGKEKIQNMIYPHPGQRARTMAERQCNDDENDSMAFFLSSFMPFWLSGQRAPRV